MPTPIFIQVDPVEHGGAMSAITLEHFDWMNNEIAEPITLQFRKLLECLSTNMSKRRSKRSAPAALPREYFT